MSGAAGIRRAGSARFGLAVVIVAVLQSAALVWMISDRISLIEGGREVVLDTAPVDPRSLFRGDYVILNYAISTLDPEELDGKGDFSRGDTVYVTLRKGDEDVWRAVAISRDRPESLSAEEVVIRGRVGYAGSDNTRIKYGIEAYFVPEGEGRALEGLVREQKLQVLVAVADDGEAAIKGLMVDGKLQYEEPLF